MRWLWIPLALWLVVGGGWVALVFVMWRINPADDVDYAPMGRLFLWSLMTWLIVGGVISACMGVAANRAQLRDVRPDAAIEDSVHPENDPSP